MPTFPRAFPRWGEVYHVDFNPARGSEQAGRRPAVVVSNDTNNQRGSVVTVAALTTKQVEERARFPQNVRVPAGELPEESVILSNQLVTIDKTRLIKYWGQIDDPQRRELKVALAIALALPRPTP
ncbi:MAG: type II toxin-antitoxin system PemK/MazF family toxin [Thermoleophilaceae bacterium]